VNLLWIVLASLTFLLLVAGVAGLTSTVGPVLAGISLSITLILVRQHTLSPLALVVLVRLRLDLSFLVLPVSCLVLARFTLSVAVLVVEIVCPEA